MRHLDRPETWLALHGFLLAFAWEMLQMPFYGIAQQAGWQATQICFLAAFGDAGIMVFAYLVARITVSDGYWLTRGRPRPLMAYLATGLIVTLAIEALALRVPWGWDYSDLMPRIAGIGLVPILMWIAVPLSALALAARTSRGPPAPPNEDYR